VTGRDAGQAIAALYHEHYPCLARIAALLVGDHAQGAEIAQDAFVSVACAWRRLPDGDDGLGFLRRAVITGARSRGAVTPDPRPAQARQPAPGALGSRLMAAIVGLPARQREALVLKYYADWPDPQIAAAMGISRQAVNAQIRRGMSAIRPILASEHGDRT
jgi:DNA-directed RNA polymerase specialized sigma24 family protein